MKKVYVQCWWESIRNKEKSAAVFAVRRANYTHRRKGVFNGESIEDLTAGWQCSLSHLQRACYL
jgi:hypothetical protein